MEYNVFIKGLNGDLFAIETDGTIKDIRKKLKNISEIDTVNKNVYLFSEKRLAIDSSVPENAIVTYLCEPFVRESNKSSDGPYREMSEIIDEYKIKNQYKHIDVLNPSQEDISDCFNEFDCVSFYQTTDHVTTLGNNYLGDIIELNDTTEYYVYFQNKLQKIQCRYIPNCVLYWFTRKLVDTQPVKRYYLSDRRNIMLKEVHSTDLFNGRTYIFKDSGYFIE